MPALGAPKMAKPDNSATRLFVYGTLAPGEENHHIMDGMRGEWKPAHVNGRRMDSGWGVQNRHPGFIPDAKAEPVRGLVFISDDLPQNWARLDRFEGADYHREPVVATLEDGNTVNAQIYRVFVSKRKH